MCCYWMANFFIFCGFFWGVGGAEGGAWQGKDASFGGCFRRKDFAKWFLTDSRSWILLLLSLLK